MSDLDKYFQGNVQVVEHPKLEYWRELLQREDIEVAQFELKRERDGLTFRPARIYVHFLRPDGNEEICDSDEWDADLNVALIKEGTRAVTLQNEAERFGLMLRELLEKAWIRFGDGFFNAVLVDFLKNSDFAESDQVAEKLRKIHSGNPSTGQNSCAECRLMIESALATCAQYLTKNLGYDRNEAETVLLGAIAYYLDERFSITNRELLGFN